MVTSFQSFSGKCDGDVWAVVPAAGSGIRMGNSSDELPKQFLELVGRPILARTLDVFEKLDAIHGVVAVLPVDGFQQWRSLVETYGHRCVKQIVPGGEARFDSVAAGLKACPDDTGIVVIHDGARPLVATETILKSIDIARTGHGAVAAVAVQDTVKRKAQSGLETLDRQELFLVQTPQTFPYRDLLKAYKLAADRGGFFTDDAQLFERLNWPLEIIEGHPRNLKLTTPTDLWMAEAIIRREDEDRDRL